MSLCFWGKTGVSARPGYSVVGGQPRQWWPIAFQNIIQTFIWKCTHLWLLNIILYLRSTLFSLEWKLMLTETFLFCFAFCYLHFAYSCVTAILCLAHECFSYAFNRELVVIVQLLVTYCFFFFFGILLIQLFPIS